MEIKKIIDFNHKNKWFLSLHITGLYSLVILLYFFFINLFFGKVSGDSSRIFNFIFPFVFVISSFIVHRVLTRYLSTWKGYILFGIRLSLMAMILNLVLFSSILKMQNYETGMIMVFHGLYVIALSIILGIFFEKSSFKRKMKNLLSVVLFVWAIYKIYDDLANGNNDSEGYDTNGDGISDSFDMDGDGNIDTVFVDTDGDGVFETIARDTTGDGIIDAVVSDVDGDGIIDTILKDKNGDGIVDV